MIVASIALHYGVKYIGFAIQSVIQSVDQVVILYTAHGSHGTKTLQPCPDSRDDLYHIAQTVCSNYGKPLLWHEGHWNMEGEQRDTIYRLVPDADMVVVLDADEIWPTHELENIKAQYFKGLIAARDMRVPMIHYWRSFYKAVLHDPAYPIRIIFPKILTGETTRDTKRRINHMGYAQEDAIVRYKYSIHGHKGEWRKDIDWLKDRWECNAQRDCHPVGSQYWNTETVNPWVYMPQFMKLHPYAQLEFIP